MSSLNDISSNSDKAREGTDNYDNFDPEYVPMEKVSIFAKFLGIFGIEPDIGGAGASVWEDVIKPTFLDGCRETMYTLADYFFGGGGGSSSRRRSDGKKHTAYSEKFKGSRASVGKSPNQAIYFITWDDRTEALERLDRMWDVVNQCTYCSVQDYLTLCGKTTTNYTLGDWGWGSNELSKVRPVRANNGEFYLNLPKPISIKED